MNVSTKSRRGMRMGMKTPHYFPMLLSNGADSALIDWTGSIASGTRSLKELPLFWYKNDRRCARRQNLYPILRTGFCLYADGDEVFKRNCVQKFDPRKGVLATRMRCEGFDLRIETFLSRRHLLVEHIEVVAAPKADCAVEFFFMTPDTMPLYHLPVIHLPGSVLDSYAADDLSRRADIRYVFKCAGGGRRIECDYTMPAGHDDGDKLSGVIVSLCDHLGAEAQCGSDVKRADTMGSLGSNRLWVGNVRTGDVFSRFTAVVDQKDDPEYQTLAREQLGIPYESIRKEHEEEWGAYARRSSLSIPDKTLLRIYETGLFHIRGSIVERNGMLTMGGMPWLWGGWSFNPWDAWFCFNALVSSNRIAEARLILGFYKTALPAMRRLAESQGYPGAAKFPWGAPGNERLETYDADEVHQHGLIIDQIFMLYETTKDMAILRDFLEVTRGIATYIIDSMIIRKGGRHALRPVIGACENATLKEKGWTNETWSVATIHRGLLYYLRICEILALDEPRRKRIERVIDDFGKVLLDNYDEHGVLCHYPPNLGYAARVPTIVTFLLFPELKADATMKKALDMDTVWSASKNPWTAARAAQVLALNKRLNAWNLFRHVADGSNSFGGLVEHIQIDGAPHQDWYTTPHGAFIHAVNLSMAHELGGALRLLPATPTWLKDFSFRNIRTKSGLLVSASARGGVLREVMVKNDTPCEISFSIDVDERHRLAIPRGEVVLKEGRVVTFEQNSGNKSQGNARRRQKA